MKFVLAVFVIILATSFEYVCSTLEDLTWPFDEKSIFWPGSQQFEFTRKLVNNETGNWYTTNDYRSGEHGGTHLDAPYHFIEDGIKVGTIPIERFIVPGFLVDISKEVDEEGASRNLLISDLTKWETENGPMPQKSVMLVKFGYSKYWNDRKKYLGISENDTKLNFPGITKEAAEWITKKEIYGIGLDVASVDPGNTDPRNMHAHKIFAANNMYNLENVCLENNIPVRNFTLIVAPMKIAEGTGAPVRIFAKWDQIQ